MCVENRSSEARPVRLSNTLLVRASRLDSGETRCAHPSFTSIAFPGHTYMKLFLIGVDMAQEKLAQGKSVGATIDGDGSGAFDRDDADRGDA
eukprot:CAMPEP_0198211386 /NCGR_PEP_ID=MMETSP1445-20131203/23572_1 /TAXON_ID=36898 /ORGANISM="Pyramimonas sp., Strain CCMP2087" /LENGTH=91 /DNA_ID=CAMNT_0043885635 /DNA_START=98 /DNA_END=374 /DNA_ORIENTATION=-